jgi:glutamate racemase
MDARPVGVFDSGVGGLTVLRALRVALPGESFVYLGDTARLPYGTKSAHTVTRYALQAADALVARGIKCLVVACNTASAAALEAMRQRYGELPVIGVIEPGAAAAVQATRTGRIAVLATDGTIRGGAYARAIARLAPLAQVTGVACGLFVAVAEEGWEQGAVAEAAAERYLAPLRDGSTPPDTLVLGCTHFPALRPVIARTMGSTVRIVDSAATTAEAVRQELLARALLAPPGKPASLHCLATDGPERFASIGSRFLGAPLAAAAIELVDL